MGSRNQDTFRYFSTLFLSGLTSGRKIIISPRTKLNYDIVLINIIKTKTFINNY